MQLQTLHCENNQLTTLHLNPQTSWDLPDIDIDCSNNLLTSLYLSNNKPESPLNFSGNPNLSYICEDASQVSAVHAQAMGYGYNNCIVDSACALSTDSYIANRDFVIYPNPATSVLNVMPGTNVSILSISIYNILGQHISTITGDQKMIDVTELKLGSYFMKISTTDGDGYGKFIKQ